MRIKNVTATQEIVTRALEFLHLFPILFITMKYYCFANNRKRKKTN